MTDPILAAQNARASQDKVASMANGIDQFCMMPGDIKSRMATYRSIGISPQDSIMLDAAAYRHFRENQTKLQAADR